MCCPFSGKPFIYDEFKGFWICADCGMETFEEDESHCPRHMRAQAAKEQEALRYIARWHMMSVAAMQPLLNPTDAYIRGSSGHSKGRKKHKKRARPGFGIEGWMVEETAAGIDK